MRTATRPRRGRRALALLSAAAITAGVAGWGVVPSSANLSGSGFDAGDGNLVVNDEALDWANAPGRSEGIEEHTGSLDDSFGNGTKEDSPVPSITDGSIPPNKSDLTRFYLAHDQNADGDTNLYLAWERVQEPSGTTNMDFELNQSSTLSSNGVTPVRTAGDVLIKYDLSQGGSNPSIGFHKWVTTGAGSQCEAANKVPCWDKVHNISAGAGFEASINSVIVTDPIDPDAPRSLSVRTFGEAAVNLTDAGILPPPTPGTTSCTGFASGYLKSRSSDSFTAAIKDFVAPTNVAINNCGNVNIHKVDDANAPLGGAVFTLYTNVAPLTGPRGAGDTITTHTCTTDAVTGDCTIQNVPFGEYWAVETTTPAGYQTAADQAVSLSTTTDDVNLTFIDVRDRADINITKVDDDNPTNPVQGAEFTAFVDAAPTGGTAPGLEDTVEAGDCTTAANGTCTIDQLLLGRYWVVETDTPDGYTTAAPQNVDLTSADVTLGENLTFVDKREFKVIVIVCQESDDSLYSSPITIAGQSAGSSIATAPANTTEAAICGIDTGERGGLHHGAHDADVTIPQ